MTDHEIEKLAKAIAQILRDSHVCTFSGPERGELHALAATWAKVKDWTLNCVVVTAVAGLLTALAFGVRIMLKNPPQQ